MQQGFDAVNMSDEFGRPAGGYVRSVGLDIKWQDGPLGRGAERVEPNGSFVETVIAAALQRLAYYNDGQFKCDENTAAIAHLHGALHWLNRRTQRREVAGVEGTHSGS